MPSAVSATIQETRVSTLPAAPPAIRLDIGTLYVARRAVRSAAGAGQTLPIGDHRRDHLAGRDHLAALLVERRRVAHGGAGQRDAPVRHLDLRLLAIVLVVELQ